MYPEMCGCEMVKKPENLAAKTVLDMVQNLCWKIQDKVPADKQEEVILKFFKVLGSCTSLEDLAAKAVKMVTPEEMKKEKEDSDKESDDVEVDEEEFTLDIYAF